MLVKYVSQSYRLTGPHKCCSVILFSWLLSFSSCVVANTDWQVLSFKEEMFVLHIAAAWLSSTFTHRAKPNGKQPEQVAGTNAIQEKHPFRLEKKLSDAS